MKTAVVILNWNGAEHLCRFLPSVVANTPTADIYVADNGSTDNSVEVLKDNFKTVKLIRLAENYGFAEGYNQALAELKDYEVFVLLNSDVEVQSGWLEPLVQTLDSEQDVAAIAPKILSVTDPSKFEYAGAAGGFIDYLGYPFCRGRVLNTVEEDCGQYDDVREVFWASGAALCVRAEVFRTLGGFCKEFFAHMEEIDLCWRMQLAGYRVMVNPRSTVRHLGGGTLATDSPQKIFFNHRNNLAMLYRCAPMGQRIVVAIVRPILDMVAALSYLVKGNWGGFCAVFRAYSDFMKWHGRLSHERKMIRGSVKKESATIYKGSILLRYMFVSYTFGRDKFGKLI